MKTARNTLWLLPVCLALTQTACRHGATYSADGRMPLPKLYKRLISLSAENNWQMDTVYAYPKEEPLKILSLAYPA